MLGLKQFILDKKDFYMYLKMVSSKTFSDLVNNSVFFEVQSNGCLIPTIFNRDFVPIKRYTLNKHDIFTDTLWQKANKKVVSNKDEESAKKFMKRYKFS